MQHQGFDYGERKILVNSYEINSNSEEMLIEEVKAFGWKDGKSQR